LPPTVATDPDRLHRFEQEARAAGMLNHPNIVAVYDVGAQDGVSYVVSELLDGETLRMRLARGAIPPAKVSEWGAHPRRFVRAWAFDSLATFSQHGSTLVPIVRRHLREFERSDSKALGARARRIRSRLSAG